MEFINPSTLANYLTFTKLCDKIQLKTPHNFQFSHHSCDLESDADSYTK